MDQNSPDSTKPAVVVGSNPELRFGKIEGFTGRVGAAIAAARKYLFSQQHEDGYWCGELEADTTLESDY
ncbi:MAG TPA: squalene--hopene cyclase, partial [Candidatus Binatia bacterium]|nr:squalene--hopene cyclase [Candidatus Binatia bacterium]